MSQLPAVPDVYTSSQASELSGLTFRQIDYYARTGFIRPSVADTKGSGTYRRWSSDDIAVLRLVRHLTSAGYTAQGLRRHRQTLRDAIAGAGDRRFLLVSDDELSTVASDQLLDGVQSAPVVLVVDLDAVMAPEVAS